MLPTLDPSPAPIAPALDRTFIATPVHVGRRVVSCEVGPHLSADLTTRDGAPVIRVIEWAPDHTYSTVTWLPGDGGWGHLAAFLARIGGAL